MGATYKRYKDESKKKLLDSLAVCTNIDEVLETFKTNSVYINFFDEWKDSFVYKGEKIALKQATICRVHRNDNYYKKKLSTDKYDVYIPKILKDQLIIVDNEDKLLNSHTRRKIIQYMDQNGYKDLYVFFSYTDVENTKPYVYDKFCEELKSLAYDISLVKLIYPKKVAGAKKVLMQSIIQTGPSRWDKKEVDITKGEYVYKILPKKMKISRYDYPKLNFDSVTSTAFNEGARILKKIEGLANWFKPQEFYDHYKKREKLTEEQIDLLVKHISCHYEDDMTKEDLGIDKDEVKKCEKHLPVINFALEQQFIKKVDIQQLKQKMYKKYPLLQYIGHATLSNIKHIKKYRKLIDNENLNLSKFIKETK